MFTRATAAAVCLVGSLALLVHCSIAPHEEPTKRVAQSVVGGTETTAYPDVVEISSGCTATLIHPQALLTASHCCQRKDACKEVTILDKPTKVAKVIVNPAFRGDAGASGTGITPSVDAAMLWLATPITGITPRKLATKEPEIGRTIRFVGFGCNTYDAAAFYNGYGTKRVGTNTIAFFGTDVDGKDQERFANVFGWKASPDDAGMFSPDDANICPGDSGGPTFWEEDGVEVLAGIHSLVGTLFGYSTKVTGVRDFIQATLPPCAVGATESCGECGVRSCRADFSWSDCAPLEEGATRACGSRGTQTCNAGGTYDACVEPPGDPVDDGCAVGGARSDANATWLLVLVALLVHRVQSKRYLHRGERRRMMVTR